MGGPRGHTGAGHDDGRATVREVKQAVERSGRTLGLVPAAKVRPDLRALIVDGAGLFGGERLEDLEAWPLLAPRAMPASASTRPDVDAGGRAAM